MRRLIWLLLFAVACGGSDPSTTPDPPTPQPPDPRFDALRAAVLSDIAANNASAASVAVWLDEEIVWVGGFGEIGEAPTRTPGENTLFMIGSNTKKLTAISLLRRVEAGQATRSTTIADVLPDLTLTYASRYLDASVHELLSHQGGVVDLFNDGASTTDTELRNFVYGDFSTRAYPLAPPGRIYNYSNPNFSLAGLLDETLDGRYWADLVTQEVFAPLGMTRTVARKREVDGDHALGVGMDSLSDSTIDLVSLADTWETAFVRPAGLVWSTPSDELRVARFLVDGDDSVLGAALRQEITTAQVPVYPDLPGGYGYGMSSGRGLRLGSNYYDIPAWSHGGRTLTHSSVLYVLPEQRFALSILSNGRSDDFSHSALTAFETLVTLPAPGTEPVAPFEAAGLDELEGTYVDPFNVGDVIVMRDGDILRMSAPLLDQLSIPYVPELRALSTRVWIATIQGYELDFAFIDGPEGEIYFRNREIVAIRWPPGVVWPRPMPPKRERVLEALERARDNPVPKLLRPRGLRD